MPYTDQIIISLHTRAHISELHSNISARPELGIFSITLILD